MMFQIEATHFTAGGEIFAGKITHAAPIIRYMKGWTDKKLYDYCVKKNWKVYLFDEKNQKQKEQNGNLYQ